MSPPVELVLSKLPDARRNGKGWSARCPAHDDRRPSLSISEGDDGRALMRCHAGCSAEAICAVLGLRIADLMPEDVALVTRKRQPLQRRKLATSGVGPMGKAYGKCREAVAVLDSLMRRHQGRRVAHWTYHGAGGEAIALVVRYDLPTPDREKQRKTFRPVSKHAHGWRLCDPPGKWPLYELPHLVRADRVYVCEGEKAAEAARSIGLVATTSAHGCKGFDKTDWTPLAGKQVVIVPDNDRPGEAYADAVAGIIAKLKPAAYVKVVRLPGLVEGGDLVDWIAAPGDSGGSDEFRRQLEAMADAAVEWKPTTPIGPVLTRLCDVRRESIRWLWPGRIPLGKLTLFAGDPGLGKSLVTLDIAARVTRGRPLPDDPTAAPPVGAVVLLSAEDDVADTIRPRLEAAGADLTRVSVLTAVRGNDSDGEYERPLDLARDLGSLEAAIEQIGDCRLVVIDPISAYLGRTDSHKNAETRALLAPLAEIASRHCVAILAVTHLRKGEGPSIYRSMGSLAFTAAARAVWAVAKDKQDSERRLLLPIKSNLAAEMSGMAYMIQGTADAPLVVWEADPVEISADEALWGNRTDEGHTERQEAAEWLRDALADGPVASKAVLRDAKECGISEKTLRRAYGDMGGRPHKRGMTEGWVWEMPVQVGRASPKIAEDAHPSKVAIFAPSGHLRDMQTEEEVSEWSA